METLNTRTEKAVNAKAERERLTVLLVDKKQIDTVLEKDIMSLGNRVVVAECYKHAIQAATNTRSDLITVNMNLLGRDSSQLISKIKEVVGASNVISSDIIDGDVDQKNRRQQILYYVVRPLEVNEIRSILEHISRKKMASDCLPN